MPFKPFAARRTLIAAFALLLASPQVSLAWTASSVRSIAFEGARFAPPGLYRQLVRNRQAYALGVEEAGRTADASELEHNGDGSGGLEQLIRRRADEAIAAIRQHRPFNDIAYRLGLVAHLLIRANDPLATERTDAEERRFAADYHHYLASTEPRIRRVFYGFRSGAPEAPARLDDLLADAFNRGRGLYPLVGLEYRRVEFRSGVQAFDDRSTAYAVAALSFNHAINDVAESLRYIWAAAGGADSRQDLPVRGRQLIQLETVYELPTQASR